MKLLGILIIINSLIVTGWLVTGPGQGHKWAIISLCLIAVFVGMFFIFPDRAIEITLKHVGTIKAAAEQAQIDANTIKEIKDRITGQSATIDAVALSAKQAQELVGELSLKNTKIEGAFSQLETLQNKVVKDQEQLKELTQFFIDIAAAQADSRDAFDRLHGYATNKELFYSYMARDVHVQIRATYVSSKPSYPLATWLNGIDPTNLSLDVFREYYLSIPSIFRTSMVFDIKKNKNISKKERMGFWANVLRSDTSLKATFYAGDLFVQEASDPELQWSDFNTQPLLDWWDKNKDSISESD